MRAGAKIQKLLEELRQALLTTAAQSATPSAVIERMQREGLSVHLVVERTDEGELSEVARLTLTSQESASHAPVFRIDQQDLTILRSLGIDPTRSLRRRR